MKTMHIITTTIITASFALCTAAHAENKQDTLQSAQSNTETKVEADSTIVSSSTTVVNGKRTTTLVTKDKDGNQRIKSITYSPSGKPRIKDITDEVNKKKPAPKPTKAETNVFKTTEQKPASADKDSL